MIDFKQNGSQVLEKKKTCHSGSFLENIYVDLVCSPAGCSAESTFSQVFSCYFIFLLPSASEEYVLLFSLIQFHVTLSSSPE